MMDTLGAPESAISVAVEGVEKRGWMEKVAKPGIAGKPETLVKPPGTRSNSAPFHLSRLGVPR